MRVNYTQNPKDLTQILCVVFNFAVFLDIFDNSIKKNSVMFHNSSITNFATLLRVS